LSSIPPPPADTYTLSLHDALPICAIEVEWLARDGMTVTPNATLARVHGPARSLLIAERTVLNFLSHLSGVATLTRRFVRAAGGRDRKSTRLNSSHLGISYAVFCLK